MISFREAFEQVVAAAAPVGVERIALDRAAGRVLAVGISADRDLPPFDRSERDGFAVRSADFFRGGAKLALTGETIFAGAEAVSAVTSGFCSAIMTGAALPPGADAVVPVEKSVRNGTAVALDYEKIVPGIHVHRKGSDAAEGDLLLAAGTVLDGAALSVAASVGASEVDVHRKVKVAVLSTGDELVGVNETPGRLQIRDGNGPSLRALIESISWLQCVIHRRVVDDETVLGASVVEALAEADAVVLSGGVSMGEKDLVPGVLKRCGVEEIAHKVAIRPGKPFWVGAAKHPSGRSIMVYGLPGNPVAVQVTFRELVMAALRRMAGLETIEPIEFRLPLAENLRKKLPLGQFLPALLVPGEEGTFVRPVTNNGSGDFVSISRADGVIVLPEGELRLRPGDPVRFHLWRNR